MFNFAIVLLASLQAIQAFTCPQDSHAFFHADVSTGCQVYHKCENSQLQTLTCPSGQAFNHVTSACEDASTVNCYETMDQHVHHHHKRAVEEVHSIDIQEVKGKLIDAYGALKPLLLEIVQDIAPTIYEKFERDYLPAITATRKEVMPFVYEKVYPHIRKWARYAFRLAGKIFEKVYRSYELSNSTHISIVSMSDIADEVSNDLKPVLQLGRFMSAKMLQSTQHIRHKREAPGSPDFLNMISTYNAFISKLFTAEEESLTSRFIIPTFFEIMEDPESRQDLLSVCMSAKSAFAPLMWEIRSRESYNTPPGTMIQMPRHYFDDAMRKFNEATRPVIRKLFLNHLPGLLRLAADNDPTLTNSVDSLKTSSSKGRHAGELFYTILNFVIKHGVVLITSTSNNVNFYTYTEIMNDLKPIKMTLLQVGMDYFKEDKDSWVNMLFGDNSKVPSVFGPPPVFSQPRTSAPAAFEQPRIAATYGRSRPVLELPQDRFDYLKRRESINY